MRRTFGAFLIALGSLLILVAAAMVGSHLWSQQMAEEKAQVALAELDMQGSLTETDVQNPSQVPHYVLNPEMGMPEKDIRGVAYIGKLDIPVLELSLPVISTTTGSYLQIAPCRFSGSAYLKNLVIGAHNYPAHFGRINALSYGDLVEFTDMDGNRFAYQVMDIEILQPDQSELLCAGEWPLSLYTCTVGGQARITVRCEAVQA